MPTDAANPNPQGEIHFWTALEPEARSIRRGLGIEPAAIDTAPPHFVTGWTVRLTVIGIKAPHIPDPATTRQARLIVLAGFGGGLDPSLAVGDVVLDPPDPLTMVEGPWRIGRIVSQSSLVATPAAKLLLYQRTGALAVDMEADTVRRAAMFAGVRLVIVRAITDTAAQGINATLLTWITSCGQIRPGPLTLGLLRRPWLILDLIRLWQSSRLAGKRLADAIRHILDHATEFVGSGR